MKPSKKDTEFIQLIKDIKEVVAKSKSKLKKEVNNQLLLTYWQIGQMIVAKEKDESNSSRQLILELSRELTKVLGRGYSRSNLFNMRQFFINYPDVQTVSGHLGWSHICELLSINYKDRRSFYEKEIQNSKWSVREFFASRYTYYLPNKEELISQVERAIKDYSTEEEE